VGSEASMALVCCNAGVIIGGMLAPLPSSSSSSSSAHPLAPRFSAVCTPFCLSPGRQIRHHRNRQSLSCAPLRQIRSATRGILAELTPTSSVQSPAIVSTDAFAIESDITVETRFEFSHFPSKECFLFAFYKGVTIA
jgi:hypothetical protein